jgi:hypothetical protein
VFRWNAHAGLTLSLLLVLEGLTISNDSARNRL